MNWWSGASKVRAVVLPLNAPLQRDFTRLSRDFRIQKMAAPMVVPTRVDGKIENCLIEATVVTGLETIARSEALEKIPGASVQCGRGRIFITTPISLTRKMLDLCSIDNCYVVMSHFPGLTFSKDELEAMSQIRELVKRVDWEVGLKAWEQLFSFNHPFPYRPDVIPEILGQPQIVMRPPQPEKKKQKLDRRSKKPCFEIQNERTNIVGNEDTTVQNEDVNADELHVGEIAACDNSSEDHSTENDRACNQDLTSVENEPDKQTVTDGRSPEFTDKAEKSVDGDRLVNTCTDVDVPLKPTRQLQHDPTKLTFRVTCNRTGDSHCFKSMGAAANFGGAIHNYFLWNVDMKKFDVEVILNIDNRDAYVCVALTKESLHRRHIAHFGPTTLRPTIAYNMVRMCEIRSGDVVCDPMCGGGSIPIEAAVNWPKAVHICGEIFTKGAIRANNNVEDLNKKRLFKGKHPALVDVFQWDACNLPLRDSSVDVFVSDLPFGKRLGHKVDNWRLYPQALQEMARVCRPETGRVCLLTQDKKCMMKTLQSLKCFWKRYRLLGINMGGLSAMVFLLHRTAKLVTPGKTVPSAEALRKLPDDQPDDVKDSCDT